MDTACLLVLAFVLAANLVGALVARHDKKVAVRRRGRPASGPGPMRVPERTFLLLAFFGGWPLLLVTFFAVRHKTRKPALLAGVVLAGLLGSAVLYGWLGLLGCAPLPSSPTPQ